MKVKNVIFLAVTAIGLVIILLSVFDTNGNASYIEEVTKARKKNEEYLAKGEGSPFIEGKIEFKGLQYFPIDPRYKITASFRPSTERKLYTILTSDGNEEKYAEYGYATFDFDGFRNELLILEIISMGPGKGKPFLAFGDATSTQETYGAGRYLDIEKNPGSSEIILDFNKAYNPYCAYNETFSCPLPPPQNLLRIPIRAGEKNYEVK